ERIAAALADGAAPDDFAVLARTRVLLQPLEQALAKRQVPLQSMNATAFRRFDWHRPSVKLLTMHSAKGLEFARVAVVGLGAMPWHDESLDDAARLLYVAMTRATHELVLAGHGASPLLQRAREALDRVAQRFAAG
ncbi:MAG: 3'-5' exonuclease, partial [Rubrivivax sp.]